MVHDFRRRLCGRYCGRFYGRFVRMVSRKVLPKVLQKDRGRFSRKVKKIKFELKYSKLIVLGLCLIEVGYAASPWTIG